jgi:uncharacterized protein YndB with AHSA1/START domain
MSATQAANVNPSDTADRELFTTRLLDAPRELVFKVWTEAKHIDQWWGPNGFNNSTSEMAVKPGGVWRYVMHGPDGKDWKNKITYLEVVPPERLFYIHGVSDEDPEHFRVTVTFTEEAGKTRLSMRIVFPTAAALEAVKKYGVTDGQEQTLDRLTRHLATLTAR